MPVAKKSQNKQVVTKTAKKPQIKLVDQPSEDSDLNRMVSEAAYYLAEQRNFEGGDPMQDWIRAEQQINSQIQV